MQVTILYKENRNYCFTCSVLRGLKTNAIRIVENVNKSSSILTSPRVRFYLISKRVFTLITDVGFSLISITTSQIQRVLVYAAHSQVFPVKLKKSNFDGSILLITTTVYVVRKQSLMPSQVQAILHVVRVFQNFRTPKPSTRNL